MGGLKQQKCIFSQFRRLEVQNQGVGRAVFLGENLAWALLLTARVASRPQLSLACSFRLTPASAFILTWLPSLLVSLCPFLFL